MTRLVTEKCDLYHTLYPICSFPTCSGFFRNILWSLLLIDCCWFLLTCSSFSFPFSPLSELVAAELSIIFCGSFSFGLAPSAELCCFWTHDQILFLVPLLLKSVTSLSTVQVRKRVRASDTTPVVT